LPPLLDGGFAGGRELGIRAKRADGTSADFNTLVRIDTPQEIAYYQHGGILQYVLRKLAA
jgi:aconitate hydratase